MALGTEAYWEEVGEGLADLVPPKIHRHHHLQSAEDGGLAFYGYLPPKNLCTNRVSLTCLPCKNYGMGLVP
jgi:hypothetical protein